MALKPIVVARGNAADDALVITCEHGGNLVPPEYASLFTGYETVLATHRGWDPGALELAQQLATAFSAPLIASTTTRLLVDLNRSIGHPQLYFEATRSLVPLARRQIMDRYYRPHRDQVEATVASLITVGRRVVHVASHSFTPELNGIVRQADIAWLYDPKRPGEGVFSYQWLAAFAQRRPGLKLRRNYPYQGKFDGLTSLLRKRYAPEQYVGIELEVNQRFAVAGGEPWSGLCMDIVHALADTGRFAAK